MSWSNKDSWIAFIPKEENPYLQWVIEYFGEEIIGKTGVDDDPDKDGVSNLLEYVFGINPQLKQPEAFLPRVVRNEAGLSLTYNSIQSLRNYELKVQVSDDLNNWRDIQDEENYEVIFEDDIIKTVTVKLDFEEDLNNASTSFMRLVVESR